MLDLLEARAQHEGLSIETRVMGGQALREWIVWSNPIAQMVLDTLELSDDEIGIGLPLLSAIPLFLPRRRLPTDNQAAVLTACACGQRNRTGPEVH